MSCTRILPPTFRCYDPLSFDEYSSFILSSPLSVILTVIYDDANDRGQYTGASAYFKTDRLRRVFTFASMYMGMSPFDAPRTYVSPHLAAEDSR